MTIDKNKEKLDKALRELEYKPDRVKRSIQEELNTPTEYYPIPKEEYDKLQNENIESHIMIEALNSKIKELRYYAIYLFLGCLILSWILIGKL